MSQPSFPTVSPPITREDAINMILSSIAMEELGLSHVLNAEGEKLQYVIGTIPGVTGPSATIDDVLAANDSVREVLNSAMQNQMFLNTKLQNALNSSVLQGPTGATGPTGPTGPTGSIVSAYGGRYMTETGSLNLTATPVTVPLDLQSGASDNVSYANANAITISEAGTYLILITMSGRSISAEPTTIISLELAINNVAQANTMQAQEFVSNELNTFTFSNILALSAGDRLSLLMSSDPDTLFSASPLGQTAGIVILRIS